MIRSLADRIHDCHQMITLYPNHPKDQAIGKYYSSPPETVRREDGCNKMVLDHQVEIIRFQLKVYMPRGCN